MPTPRHNEREYLNALYKRLADAKIYTPGIFEEVVKKGYPSDLDSRVINITLPVDEHFERPFRIVLYERLTKRNVDEPKYTIHVSGPGVNKRHSFESGEVARFTFAELVGRAPVWAAAYALIGGCDVEDC